MTGLFDPPPDLVGTPTPYLVQLVATVVPAVGLLALFGYAVRERRRTGPMLVALLLGGMLCSFNEPFVDWDLVFTAPLPAHIVAKKALGIEDNAEAKQAVLDAIEGNDAEALAPMASFWNSGFNFTSMPDDLELVTASGLRRIELFMRILGALSTASARPLTSAGYQEQMVLVKGGYTPDVIVVERGKPVRLNFVRQESASCSEMVLLPVEDALGLPEQPNLPGTMDEHPNWRRRLSAPAATVLDDDACEARLAALAGLRA